jgi:hypothetical protein
MFAICDVQGRRFRSTPEYLQKGPRNASQPKGTLLGICGMSGPGGFDTAVSMRDFRSMIALTPALYIMARGINRAGPGRMRRCSGH